MADGVDAGIRIAKAGYDATTAGDADLLFSSSWPSLPIAAEKTITNSAYGGDTNFADGSVRFQHSLGFVPFTIAWAIERGDDADTSGQVTAYPISEPAFSNYPTISKTDVSIPTFNVSGSSSTLLAVHVKCYNVDISVEREYPFLRPPASASIYDPNYGIKIAKEDENIDSDDMRDFILHSRCQSPQILSVKTEASAVDTTNGKGVIYQDPQGYTAWVFSFVKKEDGSYKGVPYFAQAYPKLQIVTGADGVIRYTQEFIQAAGDVGASIVVMRDPMFVSNNVSVVY